MLKHLCYIVILSLSIYSCKQPMFEEYYVDSKQIDSNGVYHFSLDLSDTTLLYDMSFYLSLHCSNKDFEHFNGLGLSITWRSPLDSIYREKVFVTKNMQIASNSFTKNLETDYRLGMRPIHRGVWHMGIRPIATNYYKINGIGIRLTKRKYGTS